MSPLSTAPMFPQLIEAFHSDLASVVQFTGVCILVLGFSNFIWCVTMIIVNSAMVRAGICAERTQGPVEHHFRQKTRVTRVDVDMRG